MQKLHKTKTKMMSKEELENKLYSLISHAECSVVESDYDFDFVDESEYEKDRAYIEGVVHAYKQILKLIDE